MLSTGGTVGGLDEEAVRAAVQEAWPGVSRCIRSGQQMLPFLGGAIGVAITVDKSGRASEVFLHRSTLGDHPTERCIVKAFEARQWPRPVGGEVGKIDQTFEFTAGHAEPPLDWSEARLEQGMNADAEAGERPFEELRAALSSCRAQASTGPLSVTMYLDEDGLVMSVGVGMSDASGHKAVECLLTTMKTTSFPAPEENRAKVTVRVE